MSRRRGIPVNFVNHRVCGGAVSTDDLDVGVGVFGVDDGGALVSRIGIYHYRNGRLKFRHKISMDCATCRPRRRLRLKGPPVELLESDRAMVNWISAMLFCGEISPGAYRWAKDPMPGEVLNNEQIRELDGEAEHTRGRLFFSAERHQAALGDFFSKHLRRESPLENFVAPEVFRLNASADAAMPDDKGESVVVRSEDLRALVSHQFAGGLRSRTGRFRECQEGLSRAFGTLEMLVRRHDNRVMAEGSAARFCATLQASAEAHLAQQTMDEVDRKFCLDQVGQALLGLRLFARVLPGSCIMHLSPKVIPGLSLISLEVARPVFSAQLLEGSAIDSHFPEDGSELFK